MLETFSAQETSQDLQVMCENQNLTPFIAKSTKPTPVLSIIPLHTSMYCCEWIKAGNKAQTTVGIKTSSKQHNTCSAMTL